VRSARLGVVALLPEPVATYVQAWRRALREPFRDAVPPHVTIVPPQQVPPGDVPAAVALVERAAQQVAPATVTLRGAGAFLPDNPVAYLVVDGGTATLGALETALRAPPLDRRTYRFHPHVTVAQDLPAADLERVVADLAGFRASFSLTEITLMREQHGVWTPERVLPLGARAPADAPFAAAEAALVLLVDVPARTVLLARRTHREGHRFPDHWEGLGGKAERGEPLLVALVRETFEEGGVEPLDLTAIGCFHDGDRADAWYYATAWRGDLRNADPEEHSTCEWVPLVEALERDLVPTARAALIRLFSHAGLSGL
jgi:2'-5' RNA ligase/8-oxo-dGTP pyrophosphatase MutT (NUDIX family)